MSRAVVDFSLPTFVVAALPHTLSNNVLGFTVDVAAALLQNGALASPSEDTPAEELTASSAGGGSLVVLPNLCTSDLSDFKSFLYVYFCNPSRDYS